MGERDDARRQVEQKREHMSRIAHEVSRRMTPEYAKERARGMARDTMYKARERAVENSWFGPLIGAGIGALVAKALQSRAQDRWGRDHGWEGRSPYGYGYAEGYPYAGAGYPDDAARSLDAFEGSAEAGGESTGGDAGSKLAQKASEMKDRAQATAEQVKGRIQDATSSLRERLPDRERIRESTHEDVGFWALGAMALGALFGFALPESERERELLEPARRKARELGQQAKDMAVEKGSQAMDKATEKIGGAGSATGQPSPMSGTQPPPVH